MLLDGRCRVIGVASTLILLIKANGHICETLRKVPEVHPEDAIVLHPNLVAGGLQRLRILVPGLCIVVAEGAIPFIGMVRIPDV